MDSRLTDPASVTSWRGLSFWACCSSTGNCADLACNPPPSIHQRSLAFALPTNANLVGGMTGPRPWFPFDRGLSVPSRQCVTEGRRKGVSLGCPRLMGAPTPADSRGKALLQMWDDGPGPRARRVLTTGCPTAAALRQ